MNDFSAIAAKAAELRERLHADDRRREAIISGFAAIEEDVALLKSVVRPQIDAAVEALKSAGLAVSITEHWDEEHHPKTSTSTIIFRANDGWSSRSQITRNEEIEISAAGGLISAGWRAPRQLLTSIEADQDSIVFRAIEFGVRSLMERIEEGPRMAGVVLRRPPPSRTEEEHRLWLEDRAIAADMPSTSPA